MPVSVGELFAGFTILRILGAGAMGTVYLAAHPRLPRQDALKVLSAELTADPQYRERFLREADLAAIGALAKKVEQTDEKIMELINY